MAKKKKKAEAQGTVSNVILQAKESLKFLGNLEKETFLKLRSWVRIPNAAERKQRTNDRILASLRRIGVATQTEVDELRARIHKLEILNQKKTRSSSVYMPVRPETDLSDLEN